MLETVGVRRGGGHTMWMFKRGLNVSFPYITANRRILWEQKMASVKTGMMIGFNRGSLTVLRRSKWRSSNLRQTMNDDSWISSVHRWTLEQLPPSCSLYLLPVSPECRSQSRHLRLLFSCLQGDQGDQGPRVSSARWGDRWRRLETDNHPFNIFLGALNVSI